MPLAACLFAQNWSLVALDLQGSMVRLSCQQTVGSVTLTAVGSRADGRERLACHAQGDDRISAMLRAAESPGASYGSGLWGQIAGASSG